MAASITENSILAKRYATAFFDICKAGSMESKAYEELLRFRKLMNENIGLKDFVSSPTNSKSKIVEVIGGVADSAGLSKETKNLLCFVVTSRRGRIIGLIIDKYLEIMDKNSNTSRVRVFSTKKLDDNLLSDISANLGKKINSKVICENVIDEELVGGLKIQVGSTLYDDSISEKLGRLKNAMQG